MRQHGRLLACLSTFGRGYFVPGHSGMEKTLEAINRTGFCGCREIYNFFVGLYGRPQAHGKESTSGQLFSQQRSTLPFAPTRHERVSNNTTTTAHPLSTDIVFFSFNTCPRLFRGLCTVLRSKAGQFKEVAQQQQQGSLVSQLAGQAIVDSDDEEVADLHDDHEEVPPYTNNHHHWQLLMPPPSSSSGCGPSRCVGYYDATSLYPSSGACHTI